MVPADNDVTELNADPIDGIGANRRPIEDVAAWLHTVDVSVRPTLRALGELLIGVGEREPVGENASRFTARCLGVAHYGHLLDEQRQLDPVSRLTTAIALGQWIDEYAEACEIGPGEFSHPPKWSSTEIGGQRYRHPMSLRVFFPAGTLSPEDGCVVSLDARESFMQRAEVSVYVCANGQDRARAVLDRLAERADTLNPYRGRALRAAYGANGLALAVIDLPTAVTRANVIVGEHVWSEIDLGVRAVRDRHQLLNAHGLGARRGVLLCGPPGTGKSAVSLVVARELVGDFTVIYVEAKAGTQLLSAVVEQAQRLEGPVLVILEDVDLWCRHRSIDSDGLSELLQAMDIAPDARILALASTNDASNLDQAAIRTGRFDSVVELDYPTRVDAARILTALIADLPDAGCVDATAVSVAMPERTSGSDIREIVRRAVLVADGTSVNTSALLAEIASGRYRATAPDGMYL